MQELFGSCHNVLIAFLHALNGRIYEMITRYAAKCEIHKSTHRRLRTMQQPFGRCRNFLIALLLALTGRIY